jgi:hypothetical protein
MGYEPRPGDVINTQPGRLHWLQHPLEAAAARGIQTYQKSLGLTGWPDTHTMLYFGPLTILSVTTPEAKWERWSDVRRRRWFAYRPAFAMTDQHLLWLFAAARAMIGTDYDEGQLLDIALNMILGYDVDVYRPVFDAGPHLRVCSVGVRTCFDHARKMSERAGTAPPFDGNLFMAPNGKKWHVETTPPALFSSRPIRFVLAGSHLS